LSETVRRCWTPKAPLDAEGRALYNAEGAAGRRRRRWTPKGARCITPKAFANFSPGFERSENPGVIKQNKMTTLKGFGD